MDQSAEALTYRYYQGISGVSKPDATGYKFWTQKLAGDRQTPERVAGQFIAASKAASSSSSTQFVGQLYKGMLGKSAADVTPEKLKDSYWVKALDDKKMTKARVAVEFSKTKAGKDLLRSQFATYSATVKVDIVQTARNVQAQRTTTAKTYNASSAKIVAAMKSKSTDNNARKVAAGKIAAKDGSKITKNDLNRIQKNDIDVIKSRLDGFKGKDYKGKVQNNAVAIVKLVAAAKTVTAYSPDITNYGVTTEAKKAANYSTEAQRNIDNASWLLKETYRALGNAQIKYNSYQAYLKAKSDCQNQGGTYSNSKCKLPVSNTGSGSSSASNVDNSALAGLLTEIARQRKCDSIAPVNRTDSITNGRVTIRSTWKYVSPNCIKTTVTTVTCNGGNRRVSGSQCARSYVDAIGAGCASLKVKTSSYTSGGNYSFKAYYCIKGSEGSTKKVGPATLVCPIYGGRQYNSTNNGNGESVCTI